MPETIGYVIATVRVPVHEGDRQAVGEWFEYVEPGVSSDGQLGVIRRECRLLGQKYIGPEAAECRQNQE